MSSGKRSGNKSAATENRDSREGTSDMSGQEENTANKTPQVKKTGGKNPKDDKSPKPSNGSKKGPSSQSQKLEKGNQSQAGKSNEGTEKKGEISQYVSILKEENERMMKSMMDKMFDQWKATLSESTSNSNRDQDAG